MLWSDETYRWSRARRTWESYGPANHGKSVCSHLHAVHRFYGLSACAYECWPLERKNAYMYYGFHNVHESAPYGHLCMPYRLRNTRAISRARPHGTVRTHRAPASYGAHLTSKTCTPVRDTHITRTVPPRLSVDLLRAQNHRKLVP